MPTTDSRKFRPRVRGTSSPSSLTINSAELMEQGRYQLVRLWNRGAHCGELLVEGRDGERILDLLGLIEIEDAP